MATSYPYQHNHPAQQSEDYISLYRTKAGYFALVLAGLGFSSMYGLLPSLAILIPGNVKIGRTYVGLRTIAVTLAGITQHCTCAVNPPQSRGGPNHHGVCSI